MVRKLRPVNEFEIASTGLPRYPYAIIDEPEQIQGLVIRLMDPKRGIPPNFALTPSMFPGLWKLWLSDTSKNYLIAHD